MSARRAIFRARDVKEAIRNINSILAGRSFDDVSADQVRRAAFERYLEILSEASRGIPDAWKTEHGPHIPWRQVAELGNQLRHAYHRTDTRLLWTIFETELGPLEAVIDAMIAAHSVDEG